MIRALLIVITLALASCEPVYAGYTVYVDPQRQEFTTVNGPNGPQLWKASAEAPAPPTMGTELCRPADFSVFAAETLRRSRVFRDEFGTATLADILAVCPELKSGMIEQARTATAAQLAATDYKVIKQAEGIYTLTAEEKASRQALRDRFNAYETAVNAATTIDELLGVPWE